MLNRGQLKSQSGVAFYKSVYIAGSYTCFKNLQVLQPSNIRAGGKMLQIQLPALRNSTSILHINELPVNGVTMVHVTRSWDANMFYDVQ